MMFLDFPTSGCASQCADTSARPRLLPKLVTRDISPGFITFPDLPLPSETLLNNRRDGARGDIYRQTRCKCRFLHHIATHENRKRKQADKNNYSTAQTGP